MRLSCAHAWVLLALALVQAVSAEEVRMMDIGELRPLLDADELLDVTQNPNDPLQKALAKSAEDAHGTRLTAEQNVQKAEAEFKVADAAAKTATQKALQTSDPDDADTAVTAKQKAASAKDTHTQTKTAFSAAQQNADQALKKAQDAGAIVNLPSAPAQAAPPQPAAPPQAPPAKPSSPLPAPPALKEAPADSQLEQNVKTRRLKRLKESAVSLKKQYEEANVEKQQADFMLTKAMAALTKVQTKIAESKSAKEAAHKEQQGVSKKLMQGHVAEHLAQHELKEVKESAELAESNEDEATVEVQVAEAGADSGGAEDDLEQSEAEREEANERLKQAKADVVTYKLASEKSKAAVEAAKQALETKKEAVQTLHKLLTKADGRFAAAEYDISEMEETEVTAEEDQAEAKAEEKNAAEALTSAHALASAAAQKANAEASGDAAFMKALLLDPKEREKHALGQVKDMDGFSKAGKPLVSADGAIAAAYIKMFNDMPLPDNGRNPILEAEARASLKDDSEKDATAAATAPGPTQTAAVAAAGAAAGAQP